MQAVADRAYNANSFKEYVNVDSIAKSFLSGAAGAVLGLGASKIVPVTDYAMLPTAKWLPALARDVMVEMDINLFQFAFESRI